MFFKKFLYIFAIFSLITSCDLFHKRSSGEGVGAGFDSSKDFLNENEANTIYFDYDSSAIRRDAKALLDDSIVVWLKNNQDAKVVVQGHCDERGTHAYNKALGQRRANAVKNYLIAAGINKNRIGTVSYGESAPAARGHNESAWAKNRRGVVISIRK